MRAEEPSQQTDEDVSRRRFLIWLGIPAVVYVTAVALWPIMQGIYFSFFDYNLTRPAQRAFVGLGNYLDLWNDASSRRVVSRTARLWTSGTMASPHSIESRKPIARYMIGSTMGRNSEG